MNWISTVVGLRGGKHDVKILSNGLVRVEVVLICRVLFSRSQEGNFRVIKLGVSTHSGDVVLVDDYNHDEKVKTIKDETTHAVLIGKNVCSRIDLKNIKVIEEDAE